MAKPPKKEVAVDWSMVKTKLPMKQGPPPGILAGLRKEALAAAKKAAKAKRRSKVAKK